MEGCFTRIGEDCGVCLTCEELVGGYLSKQISAVGDIALVACSLSGEGLLSKGAIFTSLFSSNEPDENFDTLFED